MKILITFILLMLTLTATSKKDSTSYSVTYLVVTETNNTIDVYHVETIDSIAIIFSNVVHQVLDTANLFKNTMFFEYRTSDVEFYTEKKLTIIKNGKKRYRKMKEKCWNIKEIYPINIKVIERNDDSVLYISPMTMSYDTFDNIVSSIDFSYISYSYENGEGLITLSTDLMYQLDEFKNIIKLI